MKVPVHEARLRSTFVRRVAEMVNRTHLFEPGERILIAVSGGPDSVALLSVLAALAPSWRLSLWAVHFNYRLRGEESHQDARFVADLCGRMGIELISEDIDLGGSAGLSSRWKGRSIQEVAREARYSAMMRIGASIGADRIALGHTGDDQAETLLMWMLRGSGPLGLSGIPPARECLFIRPLLAMRRVDALAYLEAQGLPWRVDSSNAKPVYLRNRIRQELMPVLKRFNPSIVEVLGRQADILREENLWLEQVTVDHLSRLARKASNGELVVDRECLIALPVALQRRIVRAAIRRVSRKPKGPGFGAVSAVLTRVVHGRSGSSLIVQRSRVSRDYNQIHVRAVRLYDQAPPADSGSMEVLLPVPSTQAWPLTGQLIRTSLVHSVLPIPGWSRSRNVAMLDADSFTISLIVRGWQPGDAFQPLGMGGRRKKLQDYFSDIKLPRAERTKVPLVLAPEGILWVGGHRMDHRFRVAQTTKRIIMVTLSGPVDAQETL
jgi:tRNA(Ile)-lysidine synthase